MSPLCDICPLLSYHHILYSLIENFERQSRQRRILKLVVDAFLEQIVQPEKNGLVEPFRSPKADTPPLGADFVERDPAQRY